MADNNRPNVSWEPYWSPQRPAAVAVTNAARPPPTRLRPHFERDSDFALGSLLAEAREEYLIDDENAVSFLVSLRVGIEAYLIGLRARTGRRFPHDLEHTPFPSDEYNPYDERQDPYDYADDIFNLALYALDLMVEGDPEATSVYAQVEQVVAYLEMLHLGLWVVAGEGARWTGPMPYDFESPIQYADPSVTGMRLSMRSPARVPVTQHRTKLSLRTYATQRTQRPSYKRLYMELTRSSLLQ